VGVDELANVFLAGDWITTEGLLADAAVASGLAAGLAAAKVAERPAVTAIPSAAR
jgi:pyruvate/2-oxoglutarate dehydrogenase complex dihydrolipoamide dehydrogenase (E3) component